MPMCLCKPPIEREATWPHHCDRCRGIPWPAGPGESTSVLISEAQGMCTDERPHEEINAVLDRAQKALDA